MGEDAESIEPAEPLEMSPPAVTQHLKVLERAGLITRGRQAQWRPCRLQAGPLAAVADWLERCSRSARSSRCPTARSPRPMGKSAATVRQTRIREYALGDLRPAELILLGWRGSGSVAGLTARVSPRVAGSGVGRGRDRPGQGGVGEGADAGEDLVEQVVAGW